MTTQDSRTRAHSLGARALYTFFAALAPLTATAQQVGQAADNNLQQWMGMWWILLLVLFVLVWILLPFAVLGIKRRLDTVIGLQREQLAEMRSHTSDFAGDQEPESQHHETFITARSGSLTYRVLSPYPMSQDQCAAAVADALQRGIVKEPPPGGIVTLVVPPS